MSSEESNLRPKISIVATMYRSAQYIEPFYQRALAVLEELNITEYEFVFVDDGSPDNSLQTAINLINTDNNIKVVELARNFGHHKAIITGLEAASGEYVFLIDIDLEEPPELLRSFWMALHSDENPDADVVYGVQQSRKGGWFERWTGSWYFSVFNVLADDIKVEKNLSTVRLMKRYYVQQLLQYKEQEFYFGPVCSLPGFKQIPFKIKKVGHSTTTYHLIKKYNLFINSIFAFTKKPLYFIFYFGLLMTAVSLSIGGTIFVRKLVYGTALDGWTSIMVSIWLLGGMIILFIGIIAIYLSKIFEQTKNRPFTVIKRVHQVDKKTSTLSQ